jgi:hypothetical protein
MTTSLQSGFELLPVDQLDLDVKNPRIARWLEMYKEPPNAEQIALALGAGTGQESEGGPSFSALKQSINTNRGIIHPIIVNREQNGRLVVIEGNTRVQIYREFRQERIQGDWDRIPCMVYECLSEQTIDAIRLQAHLVGVRQWDPYSKGKYLNHLYNSEHLTLDQVVDFCGGDKREVLNYINGFNDMEQYYRPVLESDGDFDATRFSAFVELQAPRIWEALLKAGHTKTDFATWVHERKLHPLNTVRLLPQILQNAKAREVFLKDGAQKAQRLLDTPTPQAQLQDATLEQIARELCKRINDIRFEELQRLRDERDSDAVVVLLTARERLDEICEDITAEGA